ncbi:HD family phosphohydrolase [Spirochaetia bacterium]|nr:HD family phosphohydrolase [Spirochaetia bacterium]
MKKNPDAGDFRAAFIKIISPIISQVRRGPAIAVVLSFLISVAFIMANMHGVQIVDPGEFEAGRVADRDVAADRVVSYIDEESTVRQRDAQVKLVPAVFRYSHSATGEMRRSYQHFRDFSEDLLAKGITGEDFMAALQAEDGGYAAFFPAGMLEAFSSDSDPLKILEYAAALLEPVLEEGIFSIVPEEIEPYNPEMAELVRQNSQDVRRERLFYDQIVTRDEAADLISRYILPDAHFADSARVAGVMLLPFITENIFFSLDDTLRRIDEVRSSVAPVMKQVDRGSMVIRKGFIVTEDNMKALAALINARPGSDLRTVWGILLLLLLLCVLLIILAGPPVIGRKLTDAEIYLVSVLAALYLGGAAIAKNFSFNTEFLPVSLVLPTALVMMLPSILINVRMAMVLALVLPLGAFFSGSFDMPAYTFALVSGVAAAFALQKAEKRMDLIRAGLIIAGANCISLIAILLVHRAPGGVYPGTLFWAAFNGVASGMLVLGFLPPLEHALNAATTFRLIELSDLNSPILKGLFSAAPGTYSHSLMVANLAEAAAQEIGANPLLARVGAYYHDIGKMENPDYFVENQTVYNKHDDLSPRLSATVIRSHVKIGLEKGRSLGLPREVMDVIGEHHGNSVITWFYNEALKREGQANMEDFSYPGNPPRSRESAVVMLADTVEAAVRTLKKPTAAKMEKFIQELINAKVEHGQLTNSELTFRDLETIKNAFVRVLAGHYHSRIEYPKLVENETKEAAV